MIIDRRRSKKQQDLRFSMNLTRVFVLYITLPNVQNEDPLKIVSKSPQTGSNVIVDRSRNEKQQDLRLSTNLTRVFVLYITLPNVQNEDPLNIVSKSPQNGSNVIVDGSRNEKQQDLSSIGDGGFSAFRRNCAQTKPSPILLFYLWEIKWIQLLDITMGGGARARLGKRSRSDRRGPLQSTVGSFTKRSEVKRRALWTTLPPTTSSSSEPTNGFDILCQHWKTI